MEFSNEQKLQRLSIKKQMNKLVDDILKFTAISANEAHGKATRNQALRIVQLKELQLNELWFEYRRFIPAK